MFWAARFVDSTGASPAAAAAAASSAADENEKVAAGRATVGASPDLRGVMDLATVVPVPVPVGDVTADGAGENGSSGERRRRKFGAFRGFPPAFDCFRNAWSPSKAESPPISTTISVKQRDADGTAELMLVEASGDRVGWLLWVVVMGGCYGWLLWVEASGDSWTDRQLDRSMSKSLHRRPRRGPDRARGVPRVEHCGRRRRKVPSIDFWLSFLGCRDCKHQSAPASTNQHQHAVRSIRDASIHDSSARAGWYRAGKRGEKWPKIMSKLLGESEVQPHHPPTVNHPTVRC